MKFDQEKFVKYYGNQEFRLNHLYKVKDEDGNVVDFKMNWAQRQLFENQHNRNVILKARQLGFTTFIQIYMLDCCLWIDNQNAGIIAHTRDDAEAFFSDKIKFAYDHLPAWLRKARPARTDRSNELKFSNGSRIRVGTGHRSGTLQYLHVSEFGQIAADRPDDATEITTGSFPTVHGNNMIWVESTAKGQGGHFHKMCIESQRLRDQAANLSNLQFKFHFFPWWRNPNYSSPPTLLTGEDLRYFDRLKAEGITLTEGQRSWYVQTARVQQDRMKQEHPSTAAEAFEASVEGAYYHSEMLRVRKDGRLCRIPKEQVPFNTFWDLGGNDETSIWFHQQIGLENRFLKFISGSGEGAAYWANRVREWGQENQLPIGRVYLPHDGAYKSMQRRESVQDVLEENGLTDIEIVPRTTDVVDDIQRVRNVFPSCWFDESGCGGTSNENDPPTGIECLDNYRKEWDPNRSVFKKNPRHDRYSHGADAFRTFAMGWVAPKVERARPRPRVAVM